MIRYIGALSVILVSTLALGCSSSSDSDNAANHSNGQEGTQDPSPDASPGTSPDGSSTNNPADPYIPQTGPLAWSPCPLVPGGSDNNAECAPLSVPLNEANPNDGAFALTVVRVKAQTQPARGQLWFTGDSTATAASVTNSRFMLTAASTYGIRDLDLYVIDHRGTGRSAQLSCPGLGAPGDQTATVQDWISCASQLQQTLGNKLAFYSTTESARDLGRAIERTREAGQKVFLYGTMYGSYQLLRYLQLYPSQADGIILDGLELPGSSDTTANETMDAVGKALFDLCGQDPVCSSKLGSDPYAVLKQVETMVDNGHCPAAGMTSKDIKLEAASFLMSGSAANLLPAIAYRLRRCDPADAQALAHLKQLFDGASPDADLDANTSAPASMHIELSEYWSYPSPSAASLKAAYESGAFGLWDGHIQAGIADQWPHYDPAPYGGQWPTSSVPMVMIQTQYDVTTPLSRALTVQDHFQGAHQTFVQMRAISHGVWPFGACGWSTEGADKCGRKIVRQFLQDPTATLDTSCVQQLPPIDFKTDPYYYQSLLGVSDAWENTTTRSAQAPSNTPAAKELLQRLHQAQVRLSRRAIAW